MHKIKLSLLILWCTIYVCSSQNPTPEGIIPIENLSRDNPNHKRIYEWLDNYRAAYQQAGDTDRASKQDLVDPQSYSSINDAIKLASNQPQQAIDGKPLPSNFEDVMRVVPSNQNDKQTYLNKRALGDFLPAAFNQANAQNSQNGQAQPITLPPSQNTQPISLNQSPLPQYQLSQLPPSPQPDLHAIYGQRSPEERISRIEKLDPFIQDHIRKLTEQSLQDGRSVVVEVKGDDTSDKSLLEQLRPILHDPSVLDQLRPQLQESKSLLSSSRHNQVNYEPFLVSHKTSDLRSDKPLLEQKERIDKLRDLLIQQQLQQQNPTHANPTQTIPWAQIITQPQPQYLNLNQLPDQYQQQPQQQGLNQRQLIQQLEALAVRPIAHQLQLPGSPQTQPPQPQNAQLIPQSPYNLGKPEQLIQWQQPAPQTNEPKLIGQKPRQTPAVAQPISFNQHFTLDGVNWQGDQRTSASEPAGPDTRQKRQPGQYELTNNYHQDDQERISPAEDSARKRQLREQLLKDMEDQERKRQELIDIDQQHRQMIEEERRKQEVRDQQDAERRAQEKQHQLTREQKNKQQGNGQQSRSTAPPPKVNSRNNANDNRWSSQEWPQQPAQVKPQERQPRPQPQQERHPRPQPQPQQQHQQQQYRPQPRPQPKPQPLPQSLPQIQYKPLPQSQPPPEIPYQPHPQRQEVQSQVLSSPLARPVEYLQSLPTPQQSQQQQQSPHEHVITLPPQIITNGQSDNKWVSVEAALNQLQQIENQKLQNERQAPIQVSTQALAQAEQSDAEYIKLLREILMSQLPQNSQQVSYVPVEAPPTRGQLTTTLPSGHVIDGSDTNWWSSEQSRQRADPKVRQ